MGGDERVDTPKEVLELKRLAEVIIATAEQAGARRDVIVRRANDILGVYGNKYPGETNLEYLAAVLCVAVHIIDWAEGGGKEQGGDPDQGELGGVSG